MYVLLRNSIKCCSNFYFLFVDTLRSPLPTALLLLYRYVLLSSPMTCCQYPFISSWLATVCDAAINSKLRIVCRTLGDCWRSSKLPCLNLRRGGVPSELFDCVVNAASGAVNPYGHVISSQRGGSISVDNEVFRQRTASEH